MKAYDYIIVGAGSAGSVLAARLSEDRGVSVLLLESGPGDGSVLIRMPAAVPYPLRNPKWTWQLQTGPEPGLEGRMIAHPRGRVLGGSSSINGMVFVRGNPRDFDGWAAEGLTGWSYADCLPYFRRMERFEDGASPYRGGDGPLSVIRMTADNPLFEAMIGAAEAWGLPYNEDYNGFRQEGVHRHQATIRNGHRASASRAFLHPAMGRPNLTVRTGADVQRVRIAGRRAVGVVYSSGGTVHDAAADREVILCAGSYKSPQLLMLSGIGDAEGLRPHGIEPIVHLPAVGRNLEDHLGVGIGHHAAKAGVSPAINAGSFGRAMIGLRWLLTGSGLGARNFWETGAFLKSRDDLHHADIQHEFLPATGGLSGQALRAVDGFRYSISLMRPKSRGEITLASADPATAPRIVHNYMSAPDDLAALRAGVRRTLEIIAQKPWDALRGPVDGIDPSGFSDTEMDAWIRRTGSTYFHPTSSCRMGTNEQSVVDEAGRVHEIAGLRVIDASILPHVTSGNTNAPVMMVAEKLADAIRGRRLPPEPQPYDA